MTERTFCRSCGALLTAGAVMCGECGAPAGTSVWDGRRGPAPGAWGGPRGTAEQHAPALSPDGDDPAIERLLPGYSYPPSGGNGAPDDRTGTRPLPAAPAAPPPPEPGDVRVPELEAPLDGCVVAPYGRRVLATILDGVLGVIATAPLSAGLVLTLLASAAGERAGGLALVLLFVGAVVLVVYLAVVVSFHGTRAVTPGKKVAGLRLVGRGTGKPLGILRVLGRYLVFSVGSTIPLVGLVMPLSPLFDGTGRRQGFHDRLVDSVLVDIAGGRNPLKPRVDTFDRAPDSEFLPSGPQPVDVDSRLRVAPGAPWAPQQSAPGPGSGGADYAVAAPPAPAPPAVPPTAPAGSPWAPVSPPPAPAAVPGSAPVPLPPPPSSRPEAPPAPFEHWRSEPVAAERSAPRPPDPERADDIESTRVFRRPAPTVRARLVLDDGRVLPLAGRTLVGRNPAADVGEEAAHLLAVSDPGRSLSKTHLQIDVGDDGVTATDRFSTNGTVLRDAGSRQPLAPGTPVSVPSGAVLVVGDRELKVEWDHG